MRMQLSQQAEEIVGKSELVIITERVDDVALLIGQMVTMGLPDKPRQHILYASGHLSRPDVAGENSLLEHPIFPPNMCHILQGVMFDEK